MVASPVRDSNPHATEADDPSVTVLHPLLQSVLAELEEATHSRGALFLVREVGDPWAVEWARGQDLLLEGDAQNLTAEPTLWWRFVHVGDRKRVREALIGPGDHRVLEYRVAGAAHTRWIRESLRRVRLPDAGERWVSVVRDITAERSSERPDEQAPEPGLDPSASAGQGTVIMLVEDDEAVRAVLARVLVREGYSLLLAGTAAEAVRVFEKAPREPKMIVCDVILPDRSGTELVDALLRRRPELPVLFMSGYGHEELERRNETSLGHPLLPKPFTPSDLVRAVRTSLEVRRTGGSSAMTGPESAAC